MIRPPHPWNQAEAERLRLIHSPEPEPEPEPPACICDVPGYVYDVPCEYPHT